MRRARIVVLGGSGHFGSRICRSLASCDDLELIVAARDLQRSRQVVDELSGPAAQAAISAIRLDRRAADFEHSLADLAPTVLVHAAGPYQGQDYRVARACLGCGSHYLDLADSREFVARFDSLDDEARRRSVLLVSGASTLPALSFAVIDHLRSRFRDMRSIEISIVPGNRTPRGLSTVQGILSYCGKPLRWLRDGRWRTVHGWQDLRLRRYPGLGRRWVAACDVPDLELIPRVYPGIETATFHAGLELAWQQWGLWALAWVTRGGVVGSWADHAVPLKRLTDPFISRGTDTGGMQVRIGGTGIDGRPAVWSWHLTARRNHGPEIPCMPAIVLARKLVRGELTMRGARPCVGLMTLAEFDRAVAGLDIAWSLVAEAT